MSLKKNKADSEVKTNKKDRPGKKIKPKRRHMTWEEYKLEVKDDFKRFCRKWSRKIIELIKSVLKGALKFVESVLAVVLTVVFVFAVARAVFPVEGVEGEDEETSYDIGVEADPIYELVGEEIEGTINAFLPIDGKDDPEKEIDFYSKKPSSMIPYYDREAEGAKGHPRYRRYGFLGFNQIINLKTDDVLVFPNVNFGEEAPRYISLQIAKLSESGGIISFYLDEISEKSLIAIFDVVEVPMGNGETDFFEVIEYVARGKKITGVHTIYMYVEQEGVTVGNIRFGR